jgi:hypothetical protein
MDYQGSRFPGVAVESRAEALRRVGITLDDRFSTTGRLAAKLAHGAGRTWHPAGVDLPLALVGLQLLVLGALRRGVWSAPALAAAVLGGQAALIVLAMRSDWPRYHVPVLLLVAVAVGVLADRVWVAATRGPVRAHLLDAAYGLLDRVMPDDSPPPVPRPGRPRRARPRPLPVARSRGRRGVPQPVPVMAAAAAGNRGRGRGAPAYEGGRR